MLLSAASATFVLLGATLQTTPDLARSWSAVQSSIVTIEFNGHKTGVGGLIDRNGLFIAHRSSVVGNQAVGRLSNGDLVMLTAKALDETSQLILLEADPWVKSRAPELALAPADLKPGTQLMLALTGGPASAELVSSDRNGLLRPSLRYAPLTELKSETPNERLGGSLVLTTDGTLVGIVNATLEVVRRIPSSGAAPPVSNQFGPRSQTISYALGTEILQKVIEGFRSPEHRVVYPSIGAFFSDAAQGVLVQEVKKGSPSDQAGLTSGDVILQLNNRPVKDSIDFAVQLFRLRVGSVVSLQVRRGQTMIELKVAVAGSDDTIKPGLATELFG